MRIFKHTSKGHYIGSVVIVAAEGFEKACDKIKDRLDYAGLPNDFDEDSVVELTLCGGLDAQVICFDDGDY